MKNKLICAAIALAMAVMVFEFISLYKSKPVEAVALKPLQALLTEHEQILQGINDGRTEVGNMGLLGSYLASIRHDGVAAHLDVKQRLDDLDKNNISILALVNAYVPNAKTNDFTLQARKYQEYALAWHDRWTSLMELFMAGGVYSAAEPSFPNSFSSAVAGEIKAIR